MGVNFMSKVNKFLSLSKKFKTKSIKKIYETLNKKDVKNSTKLKDIRILSNEIKRLTGKGRKWSKEYKNIIQKVEKSKSTLNECITRTSNLRKSIKSKYNYKTSDKNAIRKIVGIKAREHAKQSIENYYENRKEINSLFNSPETKAQILCDIYQDGIKKHVSISVDESEWQFIKDNTDHDRVLDYLENIHSRNAKNMYEKLTKHPEINIYKINRVRTDWGI